jgi:hypothetical protein
MGPSVIYRNISNARLPGLGNVTQSPFRQSFSQSFGFSFFSRLFFILLLRQSFTHCGGGVDQAPMPYPCPSLNRSGQIYAASSMRWPDLQIGTLDRSRVRHAGRHFTAAFLPRPWMTGTLLKSCAIPARRVRVEYAQRSHQRTLRDSNRGLPRPKIIH